MQDDKLGFTFDPTLDYDGSGILSGDKGSGRSVYVQLVESLGIDLSKIDKSAATPVLEMDMTSLEKSFWPMIQGEKLTTCAMFVQHFINERPLLIKIKSPVHNGWSDFNFVDESFASPIESNATTKIANCPCDSGDIYVACGEPYIEGQRSAPTPEALMRSRYTAYTQANITYIEKTMLPPASNGFNAQEAKVWAECNTWIGLQVIDAPVPVGEVGIVEFNAQYRDEKNKAQVIHERSEFHYRDERWFYVNGTHPQHPSSPIGKAYAR